MVVLKRKQEVRDFISSKRSENKKIGFVATMGALHPGHLSLVDVAANENEIVVCSIFINPLQFNNKSDFEKYPQTLDADLKLLESKKCDLVFVPNVDEMYADEDNTVFDFGQLDKVMEGVFRPGHFLGMAKVVKRLFDIITPDTAYFGEKDYQQLAIIRKFTKDLKLPVNIVGCPILRENSGLAMSSRNLLLTDNEKLLSSNIFKILSEAKTKATNISISDLKNWVANEINALPNFKLEYFEVANGETLETVNEWNGAETIMGFIVVLVGSVRLIDNIVLLKK